MAPELLIAPVAHGARRHLAVFSPARWTRLRTLPAPPADGGPVRGPTTADCAGWISGHPDTDAFCTMLVTEMAPLAFQEFEIRRTVVERVPVPVVDDLFRSESPLDCDLHGEAMFRNPCSIIVDPPVLVSADCPDLGLPLFWLRLFVRHLLSMLVAMDGQARSAEPSTSFIRPTVDRGATPGAWIDVLWSWFHASIVAQTGRIYKQQREWLTINREPAEVPVRQQVMFG